MDNSSIKLVFDAEKHWILTCNKDLDAPYVRSSNDTITLRDMLNDIEQCNERAIKQAQGLIELTCEMFIKPSSLIDKVRKEERERATNILSKVLDNVDLLNKFKELLNNE